MIELCLVALIVSWRGPGFVFLVFVLFGLLISDVVGGLFVWWFSFGV